jgi:hypothetical protein
MLMALQEVYAALKTTALERILFILDASESAAQHQQAIVALVQAVLAALPTRAVQSLYFLGNPSAYAPYHFAIRSAQWFRENRQRASLVTPVWGTLGQDDKSTSVIIGSGRIFDLEDWEGTPLIQRVILVSVGESLQSEPALAEELVSPIAQELLQRLHDPVVGMEISGPGFMPTWWDNEGYRLHNTGQEVSLVAERLEDFAVSVRYFTAQERAVQATMIRASEERISEPLALVDPKEWSRSEVRQLRADEVGIFHRAIQKESFICLHCGHKHPWNTLRCLEGAIILGELIYPSLQSADVTGFVIFRVLKDGIQCETHPCSVLRLGSGVVAMREGQRAVLYRYDVRGEGWMRTDETLEPYHSLGGQTYAILL